MLVPLADAVAATCGGKAGALGRLTRAGLPVPDGVVVPFAAHRTTTDPSAPLPRALTDALVGALAALGDPPVAVRSSADDEDTTGASAAGQHDTVLAVRGVAQVADAVRTCWASLRSPRAVAYRGARSAAEPVMAVLVQRLVDAQVAGVMFTPGPRNATTWIEASWGLGAGVVGGTVTPDAYAVTRDGAVARRVADKRTRVDRRGAGVVTSDVPDVDRRRPTLDDATARALARLGDRVAATLGGAQDIEWALVDGEAWILQARPVTADAPAPAPPPPTPSPTTLTGTPGSRGTATGTARVVRGPGDFARVRRGDVLVCPWTDPGWTPLLHLAAGVVTETGGVLSHAAIVARERGIPAVLGVPDATTALREAPTVTVDGDAGTVTTT